MDTYKEKAWKCLTDPEKQSIYLTLGQGISGIQACEILQMTKYKYLELKARSETLFKMYSDYFQNHKSLFRLNCPIQIQFRDYIEACLIQRLPLPEASVYGGERKWRSVSIRESEILHNMDTLSKSTHKHDKDLHLLIQEFDRWNNFRILPNSLQMPSPYRRRSNRLVKNYFRYLRSIPIQTLEKMVREFKLKQASKNKPSWYIALISDTFKEGYLVVHIKPHKHIETQLTIQRIYIFEDPLHAIQFAQMVIRQPSVKASRDGMDFWKTYQELVQNALNYSSISHTNKIKDFYDAQFKDSY